MKLRSITQRNLLGAGLGGVLGILAAGYFHAALLPIGCLLGVLVGWWYEEIYQSSADACRAALSRWHRFTSSITMPVCRLPEVTINLQPLRNVLGALLSALVWILRRPVALARWCNAHPMNSARLIRMMAGLVFVGLSALWLVPFCRWCVRTAAIHPNDPAAVLFLVGLIVPIFSIFGPLLMHVESADTEVAEMRVFYSDWARYADCGKLAYFKHDLLNFFRVQVTMLFFLTGAGAWFLTAGSAFVLFIVLPLSVIIGAIKGLCEVATRAGHWLCFAVTLVVTALSAWLSYPHFTNRTALWMVALFAGLLSALATEAVRCGLKYVFTTNWRARLIATSPVVEFLRPSGQGFWRLTSAVDDKFWKLLPMPS